MIDQAINIQEKLTTAQYETVTIKKKCATADQEKSDLVTNMKDLGQVNWLES